MLLTAAVNSINECRDEKWTQQMMWRVTLSVKGSLPLTVLMLLILN